MAYNGTAWLFPGQGSQYLGMGQALCEAFAPARDVVRQASELAGVDLAALMAAGPATALASTDVLQPALTAVNIGCALYLQAAGLRPDFAAGHSLGEFSALCAAGVLDVADTLRLVVARGRMMQDFAATAPGGMMAVDGMAVAVVEAVLADCRGVYVANENAAAQIVVCGGTAALAAASRVLAASGGRVTMLPVSGAWHSPMLADAAAAFAALLDAVPFHDAVMPVALNATGVLAQDGAEIRAAMAGQMCGRVRWHGAMLALHMAGAARFVEVGPKKILRGLLRQIPELARCDAVSFDTPAALRFVEKLYAASTMGAAL